MGGGGGRCQKQVVRKGVGLRLSSSTHSCTGPPGLLACNQEMRRKGHMYLQAPAQSYTELNDPVPLLFLPRPPGAGGPGSA